MKKPSKSLLMLLLCLTTAAGYSQTTQVEKPKLFSTFPERIVIDPVVLQKTFLSAEGQQITVAFGGGFNFSGVVLSNEQKYSNLRMITIKSVSLKNSMLSISKIVNPDNSISYTGRIINPAAFDGFAIKKEAAGSYALQKFETGRILQDCSY